MWDRGLGGGEVSSGDLRGMSFLFTDSKTKQALVNTTIMFISVDPSILTLTHSYSLGTEEGVYSLS